MSGNSFSHQLGMMMQVKPKLDSKSRDLAKGDQYAATIQGADTVSWYEHGSHWRKDLVTILSQPRLLWND